MDPIIINSMMQNTAQIPPGGEGIYVCGVLLIAVLGLVACFIGRKWIDGGCSD